MSIRRFAPAIVLAALLVPSLGGAVPIEEAPMRERLVEGHTVFLVIDAYQFTLEGGTFIQQAPSFRELAADSLDQERIERFPGVSWFNDQYLVAPAIDSTTGLGPGTWMRTEYAAALTVLVRADDGDRVREPCGGAVMAVRAGDPDPRLVLARIVARTPGVETGVREIGDLPSFHVEEASDGYDTDASRDTPTAVRVDSGIAIDLAQGRVEAEPLNGDAMPDILYDGSYRVSDPNDRAYVVDRFWFGHEGSYFPVWVSNLFGGETFVPDRQGPLLGLAQSDDCAPLTQADESAQPAHGLLCGVGIDDVASLPSLPLYADDPCMGYQEPSRNGHCYGGQRFDEASFCDRSVTPIRRHQALLYFEWSDLLPSGAVDHCSFDPTIDSDPGTPGVEGGCNPALDAATNGCQSGTEWPCPGESAWYAIDGADDLEGNSHHAHPTAPPHWEEQPCPVEAPNPTNHGGSLAGDAGLCDYGHMTAEVDVYYSGHGRPLVPGIRSFLVDELQGSTEAYPDFHGAYPGVP